MKMDQLRDHHFRIDRLNLENGIEELKKSGKVFGKDGGEERLLGGKIVIDHRLVGAGAVGDLLHPRSVISPLTKDLRGRLLDPVAHILPIAHLFSSAPLRSRRGTCGTTGDRPAPGGIIFPCFSY